MVTECVTTKKVQKTNTRSTTCIEIFSLVSVKLRITAHGIYISISVRHASNSFCIECQNERVSHRCPPCRATRMTNDKWVVDDTTGPTDTESNSLITFCSFARLLVFVSRTHHFFCIKIKATTRFWRKRKTKICANRLYKWWAAVEMIKTHTHTHIRMDTFVVCVVISRVSLDDGIACNQFTAVMWSLLFSDTSQLQRCLLKLKKTNEERERERRMTKENANTSNCVTLVFVFVSLSHSLCGRLIAVKRYFAFTVQTGNWMMTYARSTFCC